MRCRTALPPFLSTMEHICRPSPKQYNTRCSLGQRSVVIKWNSLLGIVIKYFPLTNCIFTISRNKHHRRYTIISNLSIKTVVTNQDRRKAIRASWGNSTYYTSYPVKFIFLLGTHADTDLKVLKEEEEHDDILLGDFQDSFHNLTYKGSFLIT